MKPVVIALLALAAPLPALAQAKVTPDWRAISFVGSGDDEGLALVDIASLRKPSAATREVLMATVHERPAAIPKGKGVVMTQVSYRFDCDARTYTPLRTEGWSEKGRVIGGNNDGPTRKIERGTIVEDVRLAVCEGEFSHLRNVPGANPIAAARELLVQRQSLIDARGRKGWQRLSDLGDAPDRFLYFAERGSVVTDSAGRRLVSTMVLIEKSDGGISRIHYLVRLDCKARTGETIFAEAFGANGGKVSEVLMTSGIQPLEPGRMAAALETPVCKGDWDTGAPELRLPDQLAREAFH